MHCRFALGVVFSSAAAVGITAATAAASTGGSSWIRDLHCQNSTPYPFIEQWDMLLLCPLDPSSQLVFRGVGVYPHQQPLIADSNTSRKYLMIQQHSIRTVCHTATQQVCLRMSFRGLGAKHLHFGLVCNDVIDLQVCW